MFPRRSGIVAAVQKMTAAIGTVTVDLKIDAATPLEVVRKATAAMIDITAHGATGVTALAATVRETKIGVALGNNITEPQRSTGATSRTT